MIKLCRNYEQFQELLQTSYQRPVFLLKHSSACGISAGARETFREFAREFTNADFWKVLVIEDRPLSLKIAEETGVPHKSPQVILFYEGQPVWHTSHWAIRNKKLKKALEKHIPAKVA